MLRTTSLLGGIGVFGIGIGLALAVVGGTLRVVLADAMGSPWRGVWLMVLGLAALGVLLAQVGERLDEREDTSRSVTGLSDGSLENVLREVRQRLRAQLARPPEDATEILDHILYGATKVAASDIHLAPSDRGLGVTLRVDGQLIQLVVVPRELGQLITNRIKVLAALRLETRAMAQDGRISRTIAGTSLDVRVSVLPTNLGERVVLRLVPSVGKYASLTQLGLDPGLVSAFQGLLERPQGVIFVTGPVGSGKSTTLYSSLAHIHNTRGERTALVTLEDPIEQRLDFLTQTPVNLRGGITFAASLRSVLRQDPNVLMVGEIRDRETAEVATQAGLTGHLILTTVHANDALGAFTRLLELGVSAYALGSASLGSVSQRLVRTLCPTCRRQEPVSAEWCRRILDLGGELPDADYFTAQGCGHCENQGYLGRHPIAELVMVDEAVRAAIAAGLPRSEFEVIRQQPHAGLLRAGLLRAATGETSLSEVLRVCA
jgi:general secretion pathway protein E